MALPGLKEETWCLVSGAQALDSVSAPRCCGREEIRRLCILRGGHTQAGDSLAYPRGLCRDTAGVLWPRATLHPGQPEGQGPTRVESWVGPRAGTLSPRAS